MEEINTRLNRLLDQDEWTEEDRIWLLNYLEQTKSKELNAVMFDKFNNELLLPGALNKEESKQLLLSIHEKMGMKQPAGRPRIYTLFRKSLTIAALLLLCIAGIYFVNVNLYKNKVASKNTRKKQIKNSGMILPLDPVKPS